MTEINSFLKEWMPTWTFVFYVAFVGIAGLGRWLNQVWDRRLHEREAEKEGIDPQQAEKDGAR